MFFVGNKPAFQSMRSRKKQNMAQISSFSSRSLTGDNGDTFMLRNMKSRRTMEEKPDTMEFRKARRSLSEPDSEFQFRKTRNGRRELAPGEEHIIFRGSNGRDHGHIHRMMEKSVGQR